MVIFQKQSTLIPINSSVHTMDGYGINYRCGVHLCCDGVIGVCDEIQQVDAINQFHDNALRFLGHSSQEAHHKCALLQVSNIQRHIGLYCRYLT